MAGQIAMVYIDISSKNRHRLEVRTLRSFCRVHVRQEREWHSMLTHHMQLWLLQHWQAEASPVLIQLAIAALVLVLAGAMHESAQAHLLQHVQSAPFAAEKTLHLPVHPEAPRRRLVCRARVPTRCTRCTARASPALHWSAVRSVSCPCPRRAARRALLSPS